MIAAMGQEPDHEAEALAAMRKAIAATSFDERLRWLQAATAWKILARLAGEKAAA